MTTPTEMTPSQSPAVDTDLMTPTQFFDAAHSVLSKMGEYRLLVAVLQDALHCFQTHMHATSIHEQQLFAEAQAWIMGGDSTIRRPGAHQTPNLSFEYVCEMLDIVPDRLRVSLRRDAGRVGRRYN